MVDGKNLTYDERCKMEVLLKEKYPKRKIARILNISVGTVYNELRRGSVVQLGSLLEERHIYFADVGERVVRENKSNCGRYPKYAYDARLMRDIERLLADRKYSPAACEKCVNAGICKATIYNYIRAGRFGRVKMADLPCPHRKRKKAVIRTAKRNNYRPGRLLISDRPQIINDRAEEGHFEIDTVYSSHKSSSACLLTMTDRASRLEVIRKLPDRRAVSVQAALDALHLPIKSITSDNGMEFQGVDIGVPWYFCHAYHSWERGTNECYNRFIRRWYPKGTDFSGLTDEDVARLEDWINNYPIKRKSPPCADF